MPKACEHCGLTITLMDSTQPLDHCPQCGHRFGTEPQQGLAVDGAGYVYFVSGKAVGSKLVRLCQMHGKPALEFYDKALKRSHVVTLQQLEVLVADHFDK